MENKRYVNDPELKQVNGGTGQYEFMYSFRKGDYVYDGPGPHKPYDQSEVMILYDVDTNDRNLILHCKRSYSKHKDVDIEVYEFLRNFQRFGGFLRIMENRPDVH